MANRKDLKLFLPMKEVPTITQQEHSVRMVKGKDGKAKPIFYEKEQLKAARDTITNALVLAIRNIMIDGVSMSSGVSSGFDKVYFEKDIPLSLTVKWCFGFKGDDGNDGRKAKHYHGEYRITKPDTDNLNKMLKDCMTSVGFWNDDCQVVEEHIGKYWSNVPGIYIEVCDLRQRINNTWD